MENETKTCEQLRQEQELKWERRKVNQTRDIVDVVMIIVLFIAIPATHIITAKWAYKYWRDLTVENGVAEYYQDKNDKQQWRFLPPAKKEKK